MSELIRKHESHATIRWSMLAGVSALALLAYVSSSGGAEAEDAAQPQVWIELGGQLSRLSAGQEAFSPAFEAMRPSIFLSSEKFEHSPHYSVDETGSLSFRPEGSNWSFSASVRYGRATSNQHVHQQTYPITMTFASSWLPRPLKPVAARFADTQSHNMEQHAIIDFAAGKDVGLGLLGGRQGSSTLNLGVRIAQFKSKSNTTLRSNPDWHFEHKVYNLSYYSYVYHFNYVVQPYHSNSGRFIADRSFHGVGPSLSWNASMPVAGNGNVSELALDWGLNAAVLFGRQKTQVEHQATVAYNDGGTFFTAGFQNHHGGFPVVVSQIAPPARVTSRSVTVPNIGGFAGLSFKYAAAKVSFGYRADFFFGAMDGGIDARKTYDRNFYGPFANISIGLGG